MKKFLITGANGLLGQKLIHQIQKHANATLVATARGDNQNPDGDYLYEELDITNVNQVKETILRHSPDVIINTAAMTQVDECETNPAACRELNVDAVQYLVDVAEQVNCFFIHLSTDFIFDGNAGFYKEDDQPNPLNKYAESKLESEKIALNANIRSAIVRTMLVYGVAPNMSKSNIIFWVKNSLESGKEIKVVNDQWRTPTLAEDLAKGCLLIAEKEAEGIFHISGKDLLTPYDMAVATAIFFKLDKSLIQEVDGSIFAQPAKRPSKTGFILNKARKELGYEPVSFKEGLAILKKQLENV